MADEPRKIDGVACEVCVSEDYVRGQKRLVDDLEDRVDDLETKRDRAAAVADERKREKRRLEARLEAALRANERLEATRPNRWVWFGLGAGSATTLGVVVVVLVAR